MQEAWLGESRRARWLVSTGIQQWQAGSSRHLEWEQASRLARVWQWHSRGWCRGESSRQGISRARWMLERIIGCQRRPVGQLVWIIITTTTRRFTTTTRKGSHSISSRSLRSREGSTCQHRVWEGISRHRERLV